MIGLSCYAAASIYPNIPKWLKWNPNRHKEYEWEINLNNSFFSLLIWFAHKKNMDRNFSNCFKIWGAGRVGPRETCTCIAYALLSICLIKMLYICVWTNGSKEWMNSCARPLRWGMRGRGVILYAERGSESYFRFSL